MTLNFEINQDATQFPSIPIEDNDELELLEIINGLGDLVIKLKSSIVSKKEPYVASEAVKFLLRRMEANTPEEEQDLHYLTTSFMTVYICFIQYLLQQEFNHFMALFSLHDAVAKDNSHEDILMEMQQKFSHFKSDFILSKIDFIFSNFYTWHFLELFAQKHQKDHGQFYTPQSIIKFMWDKCIDLTSFTACLDHRYLPSIFDPCLGIGSFICEYLSRAIAASRLSVWNDPQFLHYLLTQLLPNQIWGIEIDPFAHQLCKLNMMVHLFPLYARLRELNIPLQPNSIQRLKLFCNDTLRLHMQSPDPFENHCLDLLRHRLKFNFIVTNPPYMIRKTGFVTQADPLIYDETVLGVRGSQAYLYFMWIALQKCDDTHGQVCLITPSQWTVLEFAQHLRGWIWENCKLLDMYEFEPYKVWPKVQTDSLVFRLTKKTTAIPNTDYTLYLRHLSRKITLLELLKVYQNFRLNKPNQDPGLKFKYTPFIKNPTIKHASFSFILPNASCLEELENITRHLPRLCDEDSKTLNAPLIWNRGPNTNPVYSLVVRTSWAYKTFGADLCRRYLRPCFYWNGKTISSANGGGKEGDFWRSRDPLRLGKKETSAAEAYWPFCTLDTEHPEIPYYSLILVNKEDVEQIKIEHQNTAFYQYLKEARLALQADKADVELVHCQYNKCGVGVPVKIVHPINCGYFTRSQPRQRFFVDKNEMAVTNQCIYFTINPGCVWQDPDFFCGLLNSSLIQFFTKVHCCYDQQGRMRYFGRSMANIPFAAPPSMDWMCSIATFVQAITLCRTWLYTFIRHTPDGQRLMEHIRNFEWQLTDDEWRLLNEFKPGTVQPDTSLSQFKCPSHLQWIQDFVMATHAHSAKSVFFVLLKMSSLFQYAIDQLVYVIYQIPEHVQLELEKELNMDGLRKSWVKELQEPLDFNSIIEAYQRIMSEAMNIRLKYTDYYVNI